MARTKFPCEVLTPEGEVFSEEVEMISTVTSNGSIGLLANHEPLLGSLEVDLDVVHDDGDRMGQQRPGPTGCFFESRCSLAHPYLEVVLAAGDHHDPTVRPSEPGREVVRAPVEALCLGEPEYPA